ncbi:septum formation family protein [Actinomadura sp. K4S16]|uniref:septum formation family protein n=1 Tax=Actinomadura sp. K4S16 TaxID=1316147 RepID=UPI0011F0454A|nr:septum formation family protein [Actinomadura sp. K4S16]
MTTPPSPDDISDASAPSPDWAPPDTLTSDADVAPGPTDETPPADTAHEPPPEDGPERPSGGDERPGRPRTNRFAIAALVTGIVGLALLSIAFAVAALVQLRRRGGRGTGLALGGLGASAAWLAAAAVVAALFGDSLFSAEDGESDPRRRDGYVLPSTLKVGDCFTAQTHDSADHYVYPSPCANPHNGEVVAEAALPAGPFPGVQRLTAQAAALCKERTPDSVKRVTAKDFDPRAEVPGRKDWESGKRTVTCTLVYVGENNTLTAPLDRAFIVPKYETDFEQGDCLEKWDEYMAPPVVDCDLPHQYQVLATYRLRGKEYPGDKRLDEMILEGCAERAVKVWKSDPPLDKVDPTYSAPTKESWESGNRDVYCLITGRNGPLKRSFVPKK